MRVLFYFLIWTVTTLNAKSNLDGFHTFTFIPIYSGMNSKLEKSMEEELQKYGVVHTTDLLDKTKTAIDLSSFNQGPLMTYKVDTNSQGVRQATLNVQRTSSTIWSKDCLMSDGGKEDLLVIDSFSKLLAAFMAEYTKENGQKPQFNLIIK